MSKVPSWISLGFVLGAFFVWALPRPPPKPPAVVPLQIAAPERPPPAPTRLTTIEAVFAAWGDYAMWQDDLTEIAFWNPETESFSEFYEVKRNNGAFYFRSIPKLTRRVIRHGKPPPPECPLQFTETLQQYNDWRENDRYERPPPPALPREAPKIAPPSIPSEKP